MRVVYVANVSGSCILSCRLLSKKIRRRFRYSFSKFIGLLVAVRCDVMGLCVCVCVFVVYNDNAQGNKMENVKENEDKLK